MMRRKPIVLAFGCLIVAAGFADEVIFKSGDRLTGTVKAVADGKMTFDSAVAGPLTLKMSDIKTFSTESAVEIVRADGGVVRQKVGAGAEGRVAVEGAGALDLADIAKVNPEKVRWKGVVTAGATLIRGNTESSSASVGAEAARRSENDRITLGAGYYFANQRDNDTRESSTIEDNWFLKGQYDYFFSKKLYGYGNLKYEKDRIANLDRRLTPGVGAGYQWVERADLNFSTEGGFAYVSERYTEPDDTREYMGGRLAYHLDKAFNGAVKGFHNLEYVPSLERADTFLVNTDVGLRAAMTSRLSMEAKAQMAYNSQPSDGRDKKDLRYILGMGWSF